MIGKWLWDQPPNCAVITDKSVLYEGATILVVTHDLDDHGWQFLSGAEPIVANAALVSLQEIVNLDPSVTRIANLPPGCQATRANAQADWQVICQS